MNIPLREVKSISKKFKSLPDFQDPEREFNEKSFLAKSFRPSLTYTSIERRKFVCSLFD